MAPKYDFGKTAGDYGRFRAGFPVRFFDVLFHSGKIHVGDALLDLGTGTGTLARGFAQRGCEVTALDPSRELLTEARRLDRDAGVAVRYVEARAEQTGLPAKTFDVITAGQCWHWFDHDKAAAEARRILKPSGLIVIAHFDWIPLPGNLAEATEQLIMEHNPQWKLAGGTGVHHEWFAELAASGFEEIESLSFDEDVPYTHEAWRGRVRASAGVGASLPPEEISQFDDALADLLRQRFPNDPLAVHHRVWVLTARAAT